MSEEDNWAMYRNDLDQQFAANTPCIPFLGVFLTQIVQQDSYNECKPKRGCGIRKNSSGLENYTILEAITVRNQLEKLTHQRSVPRITSRGVGHRETNRLEPKSEADNTASYRIHDQLQEVTQSSVTSAQSTSTQSIYDQPSENHLEGERQQVSSPLQLSQSTMVAVSPRGINRAKPYGLIREKSMSDPSLDVANLGTKFNEFADDMYMHSQSLGCLQDSEPSSINLSRSLSLSADSLDSMSSDEEQIPVLKLPPSFDTTISLPNRGQLRPSPSVLSICSRKRRATTVVLRLNLAQMNCSTSPSDLLQKYQFHSLGCCKGVESRAQLRALLTDTAHNTEGQNYKLSYQREPQ